MANIPEYQQNVATRPAFQRNITAQTSPSSFGADIGAGLQDVARGLNQAKNSFNAVRDLEDAARAKEADNQYSDWLRERMYGDNGYMLLEGKNAVDSREAFYTEAEEARREFGQSLTGGAASRYTQASNGRLNSVKQQAIVHSAGARKQWMGDASNARIETFANDAVASFTDPTAVSRNIQAGMLELREQGEMQGWGQDTLDAEVASFVSGVRKNVVMSIAQSDPLAANAYAQEHMDELSGPDRYAINSALQIPLAEEQAKQIVDEIMSRGRVEDLGGATPEGDVRGGPTQVREFLLDRSVTQGRETHVDGLDQNFAANLAAMFQDAPENIRDGLGLLSGFRSIEEQERLYNAELARQNGDETAARRNVAKPGSSQHNFGNAVDISYEGRSLKHAPPEVIQWVHENAANYGMYFPMSWEPWHVEANGSRGGTLAPSNDGIAPRTLAPSANDIRSQIAQIQNPRVRALAETRLNAMISAQNRAAQQATTDAKAELWRYIEAGRTPDDVPQDVLIAAGMPAVSSAWSFVEKRVQRGAPKTDEEFLYQARKAAAMDPEQFASLDLYEYRGLMDDAAFAELTKYQTDYISDRQAASQATIPLRAAFSQASTALEGVGLSVVGLKGRRREEMASRIANFNNALVVELQSFKDQNNDRAPNQDEIQTMINRMLLPIVTTEQGGLFGVFGGMKETEGYLFESGRRSDASTVDIRVEYNDVPLDIRRGIVSDLEYTLGRTPSEEEVTSVYEAFVTGLPMPDLERASGYMTYNEAMNISENRDLTSSAYANPLNLLPRN